MILSTNNAKTAPPLFAETAGLKQESSQDNDCSPPATLNGSVSPKSVVDENDGSATSSSPSSTPTVSSTANNRVPTTTTANESTAQQVGVTTSSHDIPMDVNNLFGNFLTANNIKEEKSMELVTQDTFGLGVSPLAASMGGVDQKTFLQLSHLFSAHNPQTTESKKQDSTCFSSIMQDRKRSYPYTFQYCVLCQKNVHSSKLPCHIRQCHVGKPMFQCPACDFTSTYSKNNVKSHMVSLHGLAGDPISYMDQYAGQVEEFMKKCFPNVRGRGRPVHGRVSPVVSLADSKSSGTLRNMPSSSSSPLHTKQQLTEKETFAGNRSASHHKGTVHQKHNSHYGKAQQQSAIAGTPPPLSTPSGRFNDVYSAMLTGKGLFNDSFPIHPQNFGNDYPLQNINPLFYLHQLNGMANGFNSKGKAPLLKPQPSVVADKNLFNSLPTAIEDYGLGMEQLLKDLNRNFEQSQPSMSNPDFFKNCEKNEKVSEVFKSSCSSPDAMFSSTCLELNSDHEPRYLPRALKWTALDGDELENTVFKTFSNPCELIEKLDLTLFESLLDKTNAFLTDSQLQKIAEVRQKIGLKSFEIMFAVHRLDLHVLKPKDVRLVETIAPTSIDIRRFLLYEQTNSVSALNDNEQFILQLSKIDRLREKLKIMSFMGCFNDRITTANQQLVELTTAAKVLQNSSEFHTILHILLTCGNLINGDFNAQLVEGFRPSRILDFCSFEFPSGLTLMDVLAERMNQKFSELKGFLTQSIVLEKASKVDFTTFLNHLQYFENGQRLIEMELQLNNNEALSNFLVYCELETAQYKEIIGLAKDQIISMLQFFGEQTQDVDETNFRPEEFLGTIAEFLKELESSLGKLETTL